MHGILFSYWACGKFSYNVIINLLLHYPWLDNMGKYSAFGFFYNSPSHRLGQYCHHWAEYFPILPSQQCNNIRTYKKVLATRDSIHLAITEKLKKQRWCRNKYDTSYNGVQVSRIKYSWKFLPGENFAHLLYWGWLRLHRALYETKCSHQWDSLPPQIALCMLAGSG